MSPTPAEPLRPCILIVDDERQIHASLRLRLGRECDLVCCFDGRDALEKIRYAKFDLCFADIHMPKMDGFAFIEAARERDPALGYVLLSAFDTDENLRRAIPLQVYDFISKPLPEKDGFEGRIQEWIGRTRRQRRDLQLTAQVGTLASDRDAAQLERDIELVASETARDALLQTANLLTTIHAQLVSALAQVAARVKIDASLGQLGRVLEETRKTADAAMSVADSFFGSAYGSRDSSPALIHAGIQHAAGIAIRLTRSEEQNKVIDFHAPEDLEIASGLSGIAFLLILVPALGAALVATSSNTTVGIRHERFSRLDDVPKDPRWRDCVWLNRRQAAGSHTGTLISISASALALTREEVDAWLDGTYAPFAHIAARGLISGIQKARGLFGIATAPRAHQFRLVLALPE